MTKQTHGFFAVLVATLCAVQVSPASAEDDWFDLGGYVQPGFTAVKNSDFDQNDQEGFEFANARLTGRATREASDDIRTSLRFNFDVNQGNFSVRDVYVSLDYDSELVVVDAGQMKIPFGLGLQQSEAYLQLPFSTQTRTLSFGRDVGVRLRGKYQLRQTVLRWSGMVANGEGGFRQRRNLDNEYVFAGRVEVSPLGEVGDSEADLDGGPLRVTLGGNIGYTPSLNNSLGLGDVGAKEHRYGADLRVKWEGISLRSELILGDRGNNDNSRGFWRYGGYVQAGYVLPWKLDKIRFEPVARVEQLDINRDLDGLDGGTEYAVELSEVRRYEAGLTTYFAGNNAKLLLSYRRNDLLEGPVRDVPGGTPLLNDSIHAFFSFGWF